MAHGASIGTVTYDQCNLCRHRLFNQLHPYRKQSWYGSKHCDNQSLMGELSRRDKGGLDRYPNLELCFFRVVRGMFWRLCAPVLS